MSSRRISKIVRLAVIALISLIWLTGVGEVAAGGEEQASLSRPWPFIGVNFIGPEHWYDYQLPAFKAMKPNLAKFSLFYSCNNCPNGISPPVFDPSFFDDTIAAGVGQIIIRTADIHNDPANVDWQLNQPLDQSGQTLIQYIDNHPTMVFFIEPGNEPDQAGQSVTEAKQNLLATISQLAPRYQHLTNLKWLLPTPAQIHPEYARELLADGQLLAKYDAVAVHTYGANILEDQDFAGPYKVLDVVLSMLPSDKPIYITESGINSSMSWTDKAQLYLKAMQQLPPQVVAWTAFTFSTNPDWCIRANYAIDARPVRAKNGQTTCQIDDQFSGSHKIGERP